ncbi:unnamed protein product [Urochloa decumbens]|uniref:F-box domain-containing protein n=1 Tax=Urochloa decumbens TaxID=240449 RepID=A0ABC9G6Y8_9POAL
MGSEHQRGRRGGGSGEDRISGLPDALLHEILVCLRSADAAARTSVLSRRWRHVWVHLPKLHLVAPPAADPTSFPGTVDAALGGYLAPTLEHLGVSHSTEQQGRDLRIPARRIAPWLHFAAEHVVGEINLYLCVPQTFVAPEVDGEEAVLELPVCERAKRIELYLQYAETTWLRPQASSLFAALTSLKIDGYVHMQGSDLTALVNTQCPCLRDLNLFITLIVIFDVFIHSNSLHTLVLRVLETRRLEILAPRLEELIISIRPMEAQISAPKLAKVTWCDGYDPHLNRFVDVGRRLQLLQTSSQASSLTKQFDEVDELNMSMDLYFPDAAKYESFLNETNKLPKCKSFHIFLSWKHHALMPVMLHLLRSCNDTKKLRIHLFGPSSRQEMHSCQPSCLCRSEESRKIDGIDLSSLEVVEICWFSGSHEQMELVELLFSNAGVLKRLLINGKYRRRPKQQVCERVCSICHPNVKVEFDELFDPRRTRRSAADL